MIRLSYIVCVLLGVLLFNSKYAQRCLQVPIYLDNAPKCPEGEYKLIFSEEFDNDTLNLNVWENQVWRQGSWDNSQDTQYFTLDNVEIKDGICSIVAKRETITALSVYWEPADKLMEDGRPNLREYYFTSAALWMKQKYRFGKYEARCKQPNGIPYWPAFWLYGGPVGNEIDVFDSYGNSTELITGVGYDFDGDVATQGCSRRIPNVADFSDWHVFTLIFEYDRIEWIVDGQTIRTFYRYLTADGQPFGCDEEVGAGIYFEHLSFPRDSMSPIISMAIQANKNAPDESTSFPVSFDVDYVRIYELMEVQPLEVLPYPNPSTGIFSLKSVLPLERIEVSDISGQKLKYLEQLPSGINTIELSNYPTGVYFLRFITNGAPFTYKLVKY